MPGIMTVIKADGGLVKTALDKAPGLDALQAAVGGYIEIVPRFDEYLGRKAVAYCNEDGKYQGLPLNKQATRFWGYALGVVPPGAAFGDVLVGDIVVLTGDEEFLK
jgi:hypothetical protein